MRLFLFLFFRRKETKESRRVKLWLNSSAKNRAKTKPRFPQMPALAPWFSYAQGPRGFFTEEFPCIIILSLSCISGRAAKPSNVALSLEQEAITQLLNYPVTKSV
jgi:hypothetical protein